MIYHGNNGLASHDVKTNAKDSVAGIIAGKDSYSAAVIDVLRVEYPNYF